MTVEFRREKNNKDTFSDSSIKFCKDLEKRMPKPRQVYTPGSQPPKKGRPPAKKIVSKTGTSRKGNYRSRYTQEDFLRALTSVKNGEMSVRAASREFDVSNFELKIQFNK